MNTVLLAFDFAAPWLAWAGLAAASAPIVIHLLNRRRFRRVDWAAMRFLLDSRRRNRRRLRLEEILLLALRCLAVLLIVLAISRPRSSASLLGGAGRAAVDHVFVLDDSYSMGVMRGSNTVFSQAVEDLARLVENTAASDRLAIYLTSDPSRPWDPQRALHETLAAGEPSPDGAAQAMLAHPRDAKLLANQVRELTITDTRADLAAALAGARQCLAESTYRKKLYILSDFRRPDFAGQAAQALRAQIGPLAREQVELVLVDHGPAVAGNLAVEEVALVNKAAIVSADSTLRVTVRNHGDKGVANVAVNLSIRPQGRPAGEMTLRATAESIAAGQARTVEAPCTFYEVGPALIEAALPGDALAADNTGYLAVDVREARAVLIVDGGYDAVRPARSESFYLRYALDPQEDAASGNRVEVLAAEQVGNVDFAAYDLVIFTDVPKLPEEIDEATGRTICPSLDALRRYVAEGGALVLFTGERISQSFYNGPMLAAGLSPLEIRAAVGDARMREQGVSFQGGSAANLPMLRLFAESGEEADFASLFRFYRYHPAVERAGADLPPECGPVRVLMRLADEAASPAIVERRLGQGMVMMFYSTASAAWNDWPKGVNLSYLPVMQDMALYLARSRGGQYTDLVGRPIVQSTAAWRGFSQAATAAVKPPPASKEDWVALTAQPAEQAGVLRFDRTHWAGAYALAVDLGEQRRELLFARAVDPAEGDLAKADRNELATALGTAEFTYVDRGQAETDVTGDDALARRSEYWRVLLLAAVAVLAVEVFLAQRFGHYAPADSPRGQATR